MDGASIGRALAFAAGDMRDWPVRCAWEGCLSENVEPMLAQDALACRGCGRLTSRYVAVEDQRRRARREVLGA